MARLDSFTSLRTTLCGHWTGSSGWTFDLDTAGSLVIATNGVVTSAVSGLTLGRWHHFAVVNTDAINVLSMASTKARNQTKRQLRKLFIIDYRI